MKINEIEYSLLEKEKSNRLINFLSMAQIDNLFVKRLSDRAISIKERVNSVIEKGDWFVATSSSEIIGCRGIKFLTDLHEVHFTTFVVAATFQGRGIGRRLFELSHQHAITTYSPKKLIIDSWEGSSAIGHLAAGMNFKKTSSFFDLKKRPNGVKTVVYELYI